MRGIIAFFAFILFVSNIYAANSLLDVGVLEKNDGKAIVFIFKEPVKDKCWKIKFSGKRLDILLNSFSTELKDISVSISSVEKAEIKKEENSVKITLLLKDEVGRLIAERSLSFLTKDPHMLGIVFTKEYLSKFNKKPTSEISAPKIELPFIKYEDIFSPVTKKDSLIKESSKVKDKENKDENQIFKKPKKQEKTKTQLITSKEKQPFVYTDRSALFKFIGAFSVVLGIVMVSLFMWKRFLFLKYRGTQQFIKILAIQHFSTKQSIAIVQVGEEKFLIGITPERIELLTKLHQLNDIKDSNSDLEPDTGLSEKTVGILKQSFAQLRRV